MDTFDLVNGVFELGGSFILLLNILKLKKDKHIAGVHWSPTAFFAAWGAWNAIYYPHLGQWFSFSGGVALVLVNVVWLAMLFYYTQKNKKEIEDKLDNILGGC